MSDEYWGRPRLAPYSWEPVKKIQLRICKEILNFRLLVFFHLWYRVRLLLKFTSQTKGLGAFIKCKWWKPSERIIWLGWVVSPGIQPYHCVCKTFAMCTQFEEKKYEEKNMSKKLGKIWVKIWGKNWGIQPYHCVCKTFAMRVHNLCCITTLNTFSI